MMADGHVEGCGDLTTGCGRKLGLGLREWVKWASRLSKQTGSAGSDVSVFAVAAGACLLELGRVNRFAVGLAQIHAHQPRRG